MPSFNYKVRDSQGREVQDSREAQSEEELISRLQSEGLVVISVTASGPVARKKALIATGFHVRVTLDDLIVFSRQLATMLGAGVTLLKSLDVLSRQLESDTLLKAVKQMKHDIAGGSTFRDAMAKHPKIFSDFWVHVVETGEASGALPVALTQLADYLESAAAMRSKVTSALVYPCVLILIAIVALTVFTVWIIPIFSRVFDSFDMELPTLTNLVIIFSKTIRRYFLLLLAGLGAFGYAFSRHIRSERGKWQLDRLKFKIPILSSLFQRIAIERFASGLSTLIESGVPILYGLDIIAKAVENKVVEKAIGEVRESVRQGKGMSAPLEQSGVFTPMVVQMVSVGEEIGELGKMLKKISEFYRERIATTLTRITTLIEPAVLVIMGGVIGVLVVSMFMPIFQLAMISKG